MRRISVLLPLPLAATYDYRLPEDMSAGPGSYVRVPLGNRIVTGVVWRNDDENSPVPEKRLKPVAEILPSPPMAEELRRLVDWVAGYTLAPLGTVLRMAMGPEDAFAAETAPSEGFNPTMLLSAAGTRPEPAVSVPSAKVATPCATTTAEPLLEPPGT